MTATDIMESFQRRGVVLMAGDDRIRYRAPAGIMTDADRAALREHKVELLALLTSPSAPPTSRPRPGAPKECFSHEEHPQACRHCNGRTWRLRETPQSGGGWLWICAACADRFGDTKIAPYVPSPVEDGDLIDEASAEPPAAAVLVSGDDGDYIVGPATPPTLIESCIWCGTWTPLGVCCDDCTQRQSGVAVERISA